jgi:hypothetical protein
MMERKFFVPETRDEIQNEKGRGEESVQISLTDKDKKVFENIEVSSREDSLFNRWKSEGSGLFI